MFGTQQSGVSNYYFTSCISDIIRLGAVTQGLTPTCYFLNFLLEDTYFMTILGIRTHFVVIVYLINS